MSTQKTTDIFLAIGALFGFTGVLARALSGHALLLLLEERGKLDNFNLAADYLLFHGLALIIIGLLCHLFPTAKYQRSGWAFVAGSLLFQGTVLVKSLVSIHPVGFLTPLGGFLLMIGWGLLLVSVIANIRNNRDLQ